MWWWGHINGMQLDKKCSNRNGSGLASIVLGQSNQLEDIHTVMNTYTKEQHKRSCHKFEMVVNKEVKG